MSHTFAKHGHHWGTHSVITEHNARRATMRQLGRRKALRGTGKSVPGLTEQVTYLCTSKVVEFFAIKVGIWRTILVHRNTNCYTRHSDLARQPREIISD